jgi:hypothetical protein
MNSKIDLKFRKIKEIQSKVQTDLCKVIDLNQFSLRTLILVF